VAKRQPDLTGRPTEVVQRFRLRYAKRGRLRFTSHRDVARCFERALRRAQVPMAYTSGFTAHPRISWLGAAPTGVASEAEYVELALAQVCDPEAVRLALDASLAPGLDVVECVVSGGGSLAERVEASQWQIVLPGVSLDEARWAVSLFLAEQVVQVERLTKDGVRLLDARGAVLSVAVSVAVLPRATPGACSDGRSADCAILQVVVQQTTPAVRPDDVLAALRSVAGLEPPVPAEVTRLAQGRLAADGSIDDPLRTDREHAVSIG